MAKALRAIATGACSGRNGLISFMCDAALPGVYEVGVLSERFLTSRRALMAWRVRGSVTQLDLRGHGLLKLYMVKRPAVAAIAISGKEIASTLTSRA